MANERVTENLVREQFRALGYHRSENTTVVEEQKSEIESVKRLLKAASKTGKGGIGSPEFIISDKSTPDFLLIVECKASTKHHESVQHDDPAFFALDGALHYASSLAKEFDVIAVAVSGQTKSQLKVSTFLHAKGAPAAKPLSTKDGAPLLGSFRGQITSSTQHSILQFSALDTKI